MFRVAIADLSGSLPLMRVSDRLTDIAELIVEQAMQQAWQQMTLQFGVPSCRETDESAPRAVEVCAVGYGKLGGIELGYGSDLDLVFLHDSAGAVQETLGERPIDNQIFFVRLAQRIVHILTVHSAAGRLYEVDVRLRPSGKGGMLITQIDSFVSINAARLGPGSIRLCCTHVRWPERPRCGRGSKARASVSSGSSCVATRFATR